MAISSCVALLAVVGCTGGRSSSEPAGGRPASPSHDAFPFRIAFERGAAKFEPGDQITITEVRGTSGDMQSGICRISGTYILASQDEATLAASVTARDPADGRGPWNRAQTMTITKGTGTFTLLLPISVDGWPHVSFYGKSSAFGGCYIGTGESVLRRWWGS